MDTMEAGTKDNDDNTMKALLAIKPAEGNKEAFRFALASPDSIKLHFHIQDLLQDFIFDDMIIQAKINIGQQIAQEKNSVGSKWMNIVELINSQDVQEVDQSSTNVSECFMEPMDNYKKKTLLDLDTDDKDLG